MIHLIQHSSLVKIMPDNIHPKEPYVSDCIARGEELGYQVVVYTDDIQSVPASFKLSVYGSSEVYLEKYVPVPWPHYSDDEKTGYLLDQPGMVPDCLIPINQADTFYISNNYIVLWISVTPAMSGEIKATLTVSTEKESASCELDIKVIEATLRNQYFDHCEYIDPISIAKEHHIPMYCDVFWDLLKTYCKLACDHGVNDIMVPIFTPQYDTFPCDEMVQLSLIKAFGKKYEFDFSRMDSWIYLAQKAGIQNFTFPSFLPSYDDLLGARFLADIDYKPGMLFENEGIRSENYITFIRKYLLELCKRLEVHKIKGQVSFHFSTAPQVWNEEVYKSFRKHFYDRVRKYRVADYDVEYRFYKLGHVGSPIVHLHDLPEYYQDPTAAINGCFDICNSKDLINPLIASSSVRLRALGAYAYRYEVQRIFHMGFNYSNSTTGNDYQGPYSNTDYDHRYPSGSLSLVYPGEKAVYPSIRLKQLKYAVQDHRVLNTLHARYSPKRINGMIDKILKLKPDSYIDDPERFQKFRMSVYELIENINKYEKRKGIE